MRRSNGNHFWAIVRLLPPAASSPRHGSTGSGRFRCPGDRLAPVVIELGGLPRRIAIQQPVGGPQALKRKHPLPDDLKLGTADLRRIAARRADVDRGKRQRPPDLRPILGILRQPRPPRRAQNLPGAILPSRAFFVRYT
jgi:hypothetical protein